MDDPLIWAARGGAILLALGAGFFIGRTIPSWQEDRFNEREPWTYGEGLNDSDPTGMFRGAGSSLASGCAGLPLDFQGGKVLAALCAIAALVLMFFGWPLDYDPGGVNSSDSSGDYMIFFEARTWIMLGAAFAGYALAVLNDKGPIGPLK